MGRPMVLYGTVDTPTGPPRRAPNIDRRAREYLLPAEVEGLMAAAKTRSRYGQRDRTLILLMYRHGLRVGEVVRLRWEQVHLDEAQIFVRRLKRGKESTHPLTGEELRALRQLRRDWPSAMYVFLSERDAPLTTAAVRKMLARTGAAAAFPFPIHPHMLRHATGYTLVNEGTDTRTIQEYLGHRNIRHTERYTTVDVTRFVGLFTD